MGFLYDNFRGFEMKMDFRVLIKLDMTGYEYFTRALICWVKKIKRGVKNYDNIIEIN